jgi:hypothetical protein
MKEEKELNTDSEQAEQKQSEDRPIDKTEDILTHAAKGELTAPEPALLNRIQAAFRHKQKRSGQRPTLPAALKFDNWTQSAALGTRGAAPRERQLLFSEGTFDLDLQIGKDADGDTFSVRGQLLQMDEVYLDSSIEGIELHLIGEDGSRSRRVTDEYGRFHFSYCSPGDYTLQVILDDHDIVLQSLTIKA